MLAVDDSGGAGTPVVLLHGLTATRRYVVMGSNALPRTGHRVVAYDARGHGDSDPAQPYDYPALAGDLERVLDERGIERVGEAYAGAIPGADLAVEEPGRSPLAWQGGRLSRIIARTAERA